MLLQSSILKLEIIHLFNPILQSLSWFWSWKSSIHLSNFTVVVRFWSWKSYPSYRVLQSLPDSEVGNHIHPSIQFYSRCLILKLEIISIHLSNFINSLTHVFLPRPRATSIAKSEPVTLCHNSNGFTHLEWQKKLSTLKVIVHPQTFLRFAFTTRATINSSVLR